MSLQKRHKHLQETHRVPSTLFMDKSACTSRGSVYQEEHMLEGKHGTKVDVQVSAIMVSGGPPAVESTL